MILTAWNPETEGLEKTYLTSVVQSGSNSLKVQNSNRIPPNSVILIGEMGMEQSEIATVTTGGTDLTLPLTGNLKFSHSADEPVYRLRYDKVVFYRSNSPDGDYYLLDTVSIDVDNRDKTTEFQDNTGTGSSFYKTKFYNSVTFEETEFSDYISAKGYGAKTIGSVITKVVRRVKDPNYTILSSEDYLDMATEVNNDMTSQSERPYSFTRTSVTLSRIANQNYLSLPDDYYKFDELEYTNKVGSYPYTGGLRPVSRRQFDTGNSLTASSNYIRAITLDEQNRRILLKPAPRTNAADAYRLSYYSDLGEFTDLSQEVKTPNTLIYEYKMRAEYYSSKAETDPSFGALATKYEQKYGNELMKMQRSNRKDVGTPRSFSDASRTGSRIDPGNGKAYTL